MKKNRLAIIWLHGVIEPALGICVEVLEHVSGDRWKQVKVDWFLTESACRRFAAEQLAGEVEIR